MIRLIVDKADKADGRPNVPGCRYLVKGEQSVSTSFLPLHPLLQMQLWVWGELCKLPQPSSGLQVVAKQAAIQIIA